MGLIGRAASLASVPLGTGARFAGAAAKVALGADKFGVFDKATLASVDAAVATLSKVRGPAMKFGQVIAVFTSALPPEIATRFAALERLYESAEPLPFAKVSHLLDAVPAGRLTVEPEAAAAASLGQVHRGVWTTEDGEQVDVAVKLRYPDAPRSVKSDMFQLRTLVPLMGRLLPTLDLKALLAEHTERLLEELDYRNEARWMTRFADAWADEAYVIPRALFASESVLVSTWLDGTPLSALIAAATRGERVAERDRAGTLLVEFAFGSPGRVRAQHSDPHPGNFRLTSDGRLGVLDFGSVANGSGAFTELFARTAQLAEVRDTEAIRRLWIDAGMATESTRAEELAELLDIDAVHAPSPYAPEEFTFTPDWVSLAAARWTDPAAALSGATKVRFPPSYLLEHRAVMGTFALLCQLQATVPMRAVVDRVSPDDAVPQPS